ncbi:hypothetical protein KC340_g13439 [Hortaea werneckii]|nr:hypothetical protein KC342_g17053 [Hortaea werneckii]KAI7055824.1 hypothetical protein KC339_g18315 [Hortaea werneckii]KAI7219026.1 hypothetical protein KC365_g12442 [Hortaea werneckii]KAI7300227.1 hypothetical protein KC340_g13439 [Hortaea werneckii]KAI7401678.1 hypothetical protein KC328_g3094 [Hortaea werneckii]
MTTKPTKPKGQYSDLGGLRILAENLHHHFGTLILCPNCPKPESPARAYSKDEGGNITEDGLKRRQFRCREAVRRRKNQGEGCGSLSCPGYIKKAIEVIGEDDVESLRAQIVEQLNGSDRDLSKIQQRFRAKPTARSLPAEERGAARDLVIRDESVFAESPSLRKRTQTDVVPLGDLSNIVVGAKRKRGRSDDDTSHTTLPGRVQKLVRQAKALLEDLENLDPATPKGYSPIAAKTKAATLVQQVEPPCQTESDDDFIDLIRALP